MRPQPSPYTLEAGNFWIELCNSQKSMLQAGEWSSETGASGPLTALNYAITVNDETVGSIGLEPGHGKCSCQNPPSRKSF